MAPQHVPWGTTTLLLNHERFAQGYQRGRRYFFEDHTSEEQQFSGPLTVPDLLCLIAVPDEQGHYHLDEDEDDTEFGATVEELLGVLVGYLHGPLQAETPAEQHEREMACVFIPEVLPMTL